MRAIISVDDKRDVADFAAGLSRLGVEIFSTGKTLTVLTAAGVSARSISDLTGFPEILGGRVKTLHPAVHAGILARRDLQVRHGRPVRGAALPLSPSPMGEGVRGDEVPYQAT